MANTLLQAGAQSATFKVPTVQVGDQFFHGNLTITDWQKLPSGKLKSALTKSYATIEEFAHEWGVAGGVVNVSILSLDETESPVAYVQTLPFLFYLDESGHAVLYEEYNVTAYFRIQTSYSASE